MIRYIYEIKNKINNKTYIGQHTLKEGQEDNYMGSGILLKKAYEKYGLENFEKTILKIGDYSKEEIDKLEVQFIKDYKSAGKAEYNLVCNAFGGDTSNTIDYKKVGKSIRQTYIDHPEKIQKLRERMLAHPIITPQHGEHNGMYGKTHSASTRRRLSETHLGSRNNQYGKHWYTDGIINISAFECPDGFRPGRILNEEIKKPHKGKHWYTNGNENILDFECPVGFRPGVTTKRKKLKSS